MARSWSLTAYDVLGAVAVAPLVPLAAVIRRDSLSERLGNLPESVRALAGRRTLWIHAASVGEVLAAVPLVDALVAHRPERPVVMSTTSLTGRQTAAQLGTVAAAMLLPIDVRAVVTKVVQAVRPAALVILETEIWPSLFHRAYEAGVPITIVSGRVSAAAARRYRVIRPLVRGALRCVSAFGMQTQADADRMTMLGAPPERMRVTGNLKYARLIQVPPAAATTLPGVDGRPFVIAASTQPSEEEVVIEACAGVWQAHPECLLVLAPRRPERFDDVDALLARAGVRRQRRSRREDTIRPDTQVLLLDSLGELPALLAGARAVFVGGTLAPLGGHNVLEPAAAATPVCFGPHTENVAEAAAALTGGGGAVVIHDAQDLERLWRQLLAAPDAARAMGERARAVVRARAAVVDDTVALIEAVLR